MRKELWYVGCQASAVLPGREGNSLDLPFISDKDTAAFEAITNRSWHSRPCARGESSIIQQKTQSQQQTWAPAKARDIAPASNNASA